MEPSLNFSDSQTIAAISTPPGKGGIAIVRISGPNALSIVNSAWKGVDLTSVASHTAHLGKYISSDGEIIDEGVATIFLAPHSFTGENIVELGVHGSSFIQREILNDLIRRGVRIAAPGEFTQRAFLNGKIDLAQAEGIADLIASSSKAAHDMAINQTRGKFSKEFNSLRDKLIEFASLLELELDFSEEEVEFADRKSLMQLCREIILKIDALAASFLRGRVLKNGVPVVIAGIPNAGKSSLLNLLLNDEKAIVTDIPGTTRDTIEDTAEFDGVIYRFIDTAGLRQTEDIVEGIGVKRARESLEKAFIVLWLIDPTQSITQQVRMMKDFHLSHSSIHLIPLITKSDLDLEKLTLNEKSSAEYETDNQTEFVLSAQDSAIQTDPVSLMIDSENQTVSSSIDSLYPIQFSSLTHQGLDSLINRLKEITTDGADPISDIIVTNSRHYEALQKASQALSRGLTSLSEGTSADLIAQDIREAITHLSLITGSITTTDLLHSIFSRFCIGK
ncbi:MAG: tRNA uridine-5-carboxymethylaminomethyl(34) synthesis GTPase MnmE [Muribaculaceae bacterium]|nr:tRNA uridine-5-carboxymethylaminomethyl(34) synthesis GTPase MnmE [Muribaculaceae bacterium]